MSGSAARATRGFENRTCSPPMCGILSALLGADEWRRVGVVKPKCVKSSLKRTRWHRAGCKSLFTKSPHFSSGASPTFAPSSCGPWALLFVFLLLHSTSDKPVVFPKHCCLTLFKIEITIFYETMKACTFECRLYVCSRVDW